MIQQKVEEPITRAVGVLMVVASMGAMPDHMAAVTKMEDEGTSIET